MNLSILRGQLYKTYKGNYKVRHYFYNRNPILRTTKNLDHLLNKFVIVALGKGDELVNIVESKEVYLKDSVGYIHNDLFYSTGEEIIVYDSDGCTQIVEDLIKALDGALKEYMKDESL